ncbi:YbaK/EbsC family protein [Ornithinimicrobium pekingense]|nr:YbaK/EbsC family protein [Ornithinimicrobium pekingense]
MRPRNREVQDALDRAGIGSRIVVLDAHARTAVLAAEQLGCPVGAIANSLVFLADGEPLLVMASGGARVDTDVIARAVGAATVGKADAEQVRAATGQAIGGVAPTGHPRPLRTLVDEDLRAHEEVWAAGGTPDTVFPLSFEELVALTGGTVATVR